MTNSKLLEVVADIAYNAGYHQYYSGDSRADIFDFICWAKEFERINKNTDWAIENYMLAIEEYSQTKLDLALITRGIVLES